MGIASFSPLFARLGSPGMSILLAPVQALASFFMPVQPARASHRFATPVAADRLAVERRVIKQRPVASFKAANIQPVNRLKVMREFEPGLKRSQVGRMAISGRMDDVCAELDRIASKAAGAP